MSCASGGPVLTEPRYRRVLALCPHPDDEVIGCGGTLSLLAASGSHVSVVVATNGELATSPPLTPTQVGSRRRLECTAACETLGLAPPRFLEFPDGALSTSMNDLVATVSRLIDALQPDAIFTPWPLDAHVDHRALAQSLALSEISANVDIWSYEVWEALPANRLVDISSVWAQKLTSLACHTTGPASFDLSAHLALQRWRSIHQMRGVGYAEAFLVVRRDDFRSMMPN